jgi:hypothetical protein
MLGGNTLTLRTNNPTPPWCVCRKVSSNGGLPRWASRAAVSIGNAAAYQTYTRAFLHGRFQSSCDGMEGVRRVCIGTGNAKFGYLALLRGHTERRLRRGCGGAGCPPRFTSAQVGGCVAVGQGVVRVGGLQVVEAPWGGGSYTFLVSATTSAHRIL